MTTLYTVDTRCLEVCGAWKKTRDSPSSNLKFHNRNRKLLPEVRAWLKHISARIKPSRIAKKKKKTDSRYVKCLFCVAYESTQQL